MKVVFVLFDSLVRKALGCYGGTAIATPNFDRFASKAVTFDRHYVGSLPCMPARRDLHTGRLNFLHRSWGPLEPFDNSFPELLRRRRIYTHLVSDHCHYFEDGGWTYHQRYSSWEFVRGQETDKWKAMVQAPLERFREMYDLEQYDFDQWESRWRTRAVNSRVHPRRGGLPLRALLRGGVRVPRPEPRRRRLVPAARGVEDEAAWREIRANYAALVAMCDHHFGRLLDYFDEHDLWRDTALILTTDHGFLLAEHDWWGKNRMPFYDEIAHIPFVMYHPAWAGRGGARRRALPQAIDVMPTILELFGIDEIFYKPVALPLPRLPPLTSKPRVRLAG